MNAPSTSSPAISFIGRKNSGKTTLLEKLIAISPIKVYELPR